MKRPALLCLLALPLLVGGCGKTETEKFDDRFEAKQAEIEAKAKELEEQADAMAAEQQKSQAQ